MMRTTMKKLGLLVLLLCGLTLACHDQNAGGAEETPKERGRHPAGSEETSEPAPEKAPLTRWPSARCDDLNTGISPSSRDADTGEVAWTWDAGSRLWQTPVVADGVLYVGDFSLGFYAVRVRDGRQLWRSRPRIVKTKADEVAAPDEVMSDRVLGEDLDDHYGYSNPVLDDRQVVAVTEYGVMTSFDRADGRVLWDHDFGAKVYSSPRIQGPRLLVNCTDGYFYCFDKNSGEVLWRYWTGRKMLGSSCAILSDTRVIFPAHDGLLHLVDTTTGEGIKRYDITGQSASTPLIAFGAAYFTAKGKGLCCFDLVDGQMRWSHRVVRGASHCLAKSGENVLVHGRNFLYAFHGVTGALSWKTDVGAEGGVAPCVGPRLAYLTTVNAEAFAMDVRDGRIVWRKSFGAASRSHPILADGLLLVSNLKGRMTAFK